MKNYPQWLREAAAKGGRNSRRELTPEQAKAMVRAREKKRRETKLALRRSNAQVNQARPAAVWGKTAFNILNY